MRGVGEPPLTVIPDRKQKKSRSYWKPDIAAKCKECGAEGKVSPGASHKYFKNGYICYPCGVEKREKDKKELQQAQINLAKRKGLIK